MNNEKYSRIILKDPGYSLLSIGSMFLGVVVVWLINSTLLIPALAAADIGIRGYSLLLSGINTALLFMLIPRLYFKRRFIDHRIFTGLNGRLSKGHGAIFIMLALGAFLFTQFVQFYWLRLLDVFGLKYSLSNLPDGIYTFEGFVLCLAFIVILPAVTEEFLFRGVLMRSISGIHGSVWGVSVSAVLFCLMHMNVASIPTTLIVGAVIGYAVTKSNSLKGGVVMHAFHNFMVVALNFLAYFLRDYAEVTESSAISIAYAVAGTFIMLMAILLIRRNGPLPGALPVNRAAIPLRKKLDMLPFIIAGLLLLVLMR